MKFVFKIEYDGSKYLGWQKQKNLPTIQFYVEKALSKIANHTVHVFCAGRTDKGVHSFGQIVHFETNVVRDNKKWLIGINSLLPKDITVCWFQEVSLDFHARFSAISRSYRYIILNNLIRSSFLNKYSTHIYSNLNVVKMNSVCKLFIGEHDFESFRGVGCYSSSSIRKITQFNITKIDKFIIIDITANSFLYHMVRNIVGCLILIGLEKKNKMWIFDLLSKKNKKFHVTAPPYGLYLTSVVYPSFYNIPVDINFKKKYFF